MRRQSRPLVVAQPEAEAMLRRAWRFRRRGEHRRAMLVLREVCHREPDEAKLWTLYAVQCVRMGRRADAASALKQAAFLRQRDREHARARVTRALLDSLLAGNDTMRIEAA
jgi:Flp pilus assembly protein TadD